MADYGGQNMFGRLRRVVVRRPDASFGEADPARWHYTASPDLDAARAEHEAFTALLAGAGAEVLYHDVDLEGRADAIFVHDPALITDKGAVILRMGKTLRDGEEAALTIYLGSLGIPIRAVLSGDALAEAGDLLWIDETTLCVAQGYRTNAAGWEQLYDALSGDGVDVVAIPLPHYHGPEACLHLKSLISVLDRDLAVVYPALLPVPFLGFLREKGIRMVEVPEEEFATMGPNVLPLAPRNVVMLRGNPRTKRLLEEAGCEVAEYAGDELSLKAEGGPTCLTRPILRDV